MPAPPGAGAPARADGTKGRRDAEGRGAAAAEPPPQEHRRGPQKGKGNRSRPNRCQRAPKPTHKQTKHSIVQTPAEC